MDQTLTEDDYVFLPVEEAVSPSKAGHFEHRVNSWWHVHPDKGLVFYNPRNPSTGRRRHAHAGAPQCNTNERIARTVAELAPFQAEIRFFPSVWVQIDLNEYRTG
jgi:hypothetical protein